MVSPKACKIEFAKKWLFQNDDNSEIIGKLLELLCHNSSRLGKVRIPALGKSNAVNMTAAQGD